MEDQPAQTTPTELNSSLAAGTTEAAGGRRLWRVIRWLLLGFVLIVAAAGVVGYWIGSQQREQARTEAVHQVAQEQFDLSLQDLDAGRYEIAQQRLEYVIQIDPSFPGAPDRLAQALLALNAPTSEPTASASPTPNLSPVQDLYEQAKTAFKNSDWTTAIDTLVLMKSKDPSYNAIARDDLMYLALRSRGVDLISNQGQLEQGIYDLSRAEQFGPLDRDADNWRSWAELYLQANSYMGVNWAQAVSYFAQVYLVAPYLRNDAYIKYAISAQSYGDLLVAAGDPCGAETMYGQSLLAWDNATVYPTATEAHQACKTATSRPRHTKPTETPTTEGGSEPTETPSETPGP